MQGLSATARNAALLAGLLLTFFVLISYQANRATTVSSARGAVLHAVSPVQRIASGIGDLFSSLWTGYFALVGAQQEAESLQNQVDALQRQMASVEETRQENARLRALVGLGPRVGLDHIVAEVVGRDLPHRYESLTLGRGTADGIRSDATVLSPDGVLVGRIVFATRWTSQVQLVTDPLSGVGARLASSRAAGLVTGNNGPDLSLQYIETMTPLYAGEPVVTSGEDGIYPAGLPIGRVESFEVGPPVPGTPRVPLAREETALFMEVRVAGGVDVTRLESVLVVASRSRS